MQAFEHMTVGDIVAHDIRTADVLARHGIDFCCGGRTALDIACRARGVDAAAVAAELVAVGEQSDPAADLTTQTLDEIIERIVSQHHEYVRTAVPVIAGYLAKLTERHGPRCPELSLLARVFETVQSELMRHMVKEEAVLFPCIAAMAAAEREHRVAPATPFGTIRNPIRMMEAEHEDAAGSLKLARLISDNYTPPEYACATWRACYASLDAFERDLYQHVHLENNVLFPAAVRLEDALRG